MPKNGNCYIVKQKSNFRKNIPFMPLKADTNSDPERLV